MITDHLLEGARDGRTVAELMVSGCEVLSRDDAGRVRLRERIQIGRSDERQGFWSGSPHADVEGSPLLRHRVELGNGSVADDALATPMACISEFHYPDSDVPTEGVALALAGGGCQSTWQGERL